MDIYKKVENKLTEIKNKVLLIKDSEDIENEKINHLKQNISNKINESDFLRFHRIPHT